MGGYDKSLSQRVVVRLAADWNREQLHAASPGDILAPTLEPFYR